MDDLGKKLERKRVELNEDSASLEENSGTTTIIRKSSRAQAPTKKFVDYVASKVKRAAYVADEIFTVDDDDDDDDDDDMENENEAVEVLKPVSAEELLQHTAIAGASLYQFSTPKKRGAMSTAALSATPTTTPQTSTNEETKRKKQALTTKTPHRARRQLREEIAKALTESDSDSDFSTDNSDFVPTESESTDTAESSASEAGNESVETMKTPQTKSASIRNTRRRRRNQAVANVTSGFIPESDAYFQAFANKKIATSDHTLARLSNPRLPADRVFNLLSKMKPTTEHECKIRELMEDYSLDFPKWYNLLSEGFNLLIYGLGSKRQLLQYFHGRQLAEQSVLVVNGFFPSLTLKDILDNITNGILEHAASVAGNPHDAVNLIEQEFALNPEAQLYIIIHNLDGIMLRNAKSQAVLSRLAKIANIHLIASIDHINTPLLWDQTKLSNFNFIWWDCTTMTPYTAETTYENSLLVQNSNALCLASMRSVFQSLTSNSRGIYMLIVRHQLEHKGRQNYQVAKLRFNLGMPFKDLYWSCREAFLVSSDLALRAQLTEFLDHKLVKSKRSADGTEQLTIPIDNDLLQEFLEEQVK